MSTNVLIHGFSHDGHNSLSVLLQCKNDLWTLRFRDDCKPFDPVRYLSKLGAGELAEKPPREAVGIRLALKIAEDVRYTYSMNLKNLLYLPKSFIYGTGILG